MKLDPPDRDNLVRLLCTLTSAARDYLITLIYAVQQLDTDPNHAIRNHTVPHTPQWRELLINQPPSNPPT